MNIIVLKQYFKSYMIALLCYGKLEQVWQEMYYVCKCSHLSSDCPSLRARTHGVENLPNNTIICQIFVLFGKYYFYLGTLFAHVDAA